MIEEGNYYTVNEAAQILELSPACVRQMLRAGELEGERREERIEGVLGPWRISKRAVRILREEKPEVLRRKRRKVCAADTTTAGPPLDEVTTVDVLPEEALANEISADTPSEASELLSESVREVRETAEGLREDLERLEGYLEQMEITETALREGLRQEKERGDRERERAERLRVELEEERARRGGESQEF